ncbi:MAG: hypothetical protein ACLVKI_11530 [Gordonibacter urolithinfaciens]
MELYSRRTFLKGALVGIGSVAAFGVAGCASAPQEKDPAAAPAGQAVQAAEPQDGPSRTGNTVTMSAGEAHGRHAAPLLDMLAQLGMGESGGDEELKETWAPTC